MKKRITTVFLSLLLLLSLFMPMNVEAAGSGVHFKDGLEAIEDQSMLADLKAQADAIYENTGYQVLFVTTKEDEDDDISAILEATYRSWNGETPGVGVVISQKGSFVISYYGQTEDNLSSDQREQIFKSIESAGSIPEAIETCLAVEEECLGSLEPVEKIPLPVDGGTTINKESVRLVDMAGLLNEGDQQKLHAKLDEVSNAHGMDIVVVTTNDLKGKEPQAYADDYFDYNGYSPSGVLLLVSKDGENHWHISTTGTAIGIFNDDARAYMSDDFVPCFSDGEFMDGFMIYANGCDEILTMAENGETFKDRMGYKAILVSLVVGFLLAFFMAQYKKGKLKSVVEQCSAHDYSKEGSVQLHTHYDNFVTRTTTSRVVSSSNNDTHTSSSGTDHGGSGGSF